MTTFDLEESSKSEPSQASPDHSYPLRLDVLAGVAGRALQMVNGDQVDLQVVAGGLKQGDPVPRPTIILGVCSSRIMTLHCIVGIERVGYHCKFKENDVDQHIPWAGEPQCTQKLSLLA